MLTAAQRVKFFKLARAAHANAAPREPFDAWRHREMEKACGSGSVFEVDRTWGYDALMGHFAVLACDYAACAYFADAAERRVRWVLAGFTRDLEWLQMTGVEESYIEAIYHQAGMAPKDFKDATCRDLMLLIPMLDTRIRKLAAECGHDLAALPTAGAPWRFRGPRAATLRAYLDRIRIQADEATKNPVPRKEVLSA